MSTVAELANAVVSNADQKDLLRLSWGVLSVDMEGTGLMLMANLFKTSSAARTKFARLGDVSAGKDNSKLRGHSITLMYALQNFIDALDNVDRLKCVVEKFAVNHINRQISADEFGEIVGPLRQTLKARMGSYFDEDTVSAWASLVAVVQAAL
uniref:Globin-1 subunit beta n=1 Tax=Anadara trapezia TaxID=6556 RepID=GLB1B_ANATR|nr:RecName: Full=Globin-1 subunit beta; Short=Globin I beta chain [Anadara trapezia]AAA62149.1 beta globin [Anadara trapezia]